MSKGDVTLTREEVQYLLACAILGEQYAVHAGVVGQRHWEKFHTMEVLLNNKLSAAEASEKVCHTCGGRGSVTNPMADPADCPSCSGTGKAKP